jgi:putative acetyltransferase
MIPIDGEPVGVGLGPMCVLKELQPTGVGARLTRFGLKALEGAGESLVFVLGHDTCYPKFGFSEATAKLFTSPWSGPHFMALRLAPGDPGTGTLTYPKAFGG